MDSERLAKAYELAAVSLRLSPGNIRDAFDFAALELGETDEEVDEFDDEMWDGMFDRLEEFENVDFWTGHMGGGYVRPGVLRLASESIWVVRIENNDGEVEVRALREFESDDAAKSAISEIDLDLEPDAAELDAYFEARRLAEMKRRAGRLDESDAAFMDDLHHGRIDASQLEAEDS